MKTALVIITLTSCAIILLEYLFTRWLQVLLDKMTKNYHEVKKLNTALITFALMNIVKIGEETEDYEMAQKAMDYLESEGLLDEAKRIINDESK